MIANLIQQIVEPIYGNVYKTFHHQYARASENVMLDALK